MPDIQATSPTGETASPPKGPAFSEILADPAIRERFDKVRRWFFVRESTYDVSNRCNLRCEGCYYYQGEKQFASENRDPEAWRALMRAERERGITYVVLAGAEPSLSPEILEVCHQEMPLGSIATNGVKRIGGGVGYRLHVSVWGDEATSREYRCMPDLLERQMDNYQGDERAVFVYTFTRVNVPEIRRVAEKLAARDCRLTFNVFSSPLGYDGPLRHTPESLREMRRAMLEVMESFPEHVLFSPYNAVAHSHTKGLHDLYACSYPRQNSSQAIGLGRSFRQYRADLSWDRNVACCVPDTDCTDCRHYAPGSAVVTARMFRHAAQRDTFAAWLDYADTYLAVWVMGYEKGANLMPVPVAPPGETLE